MTEFDLKRKSIIEESVPSVVLPLEVMLRMRTCTCSMNNLPSHTFLNAVMHEIRFVLFTCSEFQTWESDFNTDFYFKGLMSSAIRFTLWHTSALQISLTFTAVERSGSVVSVGWSKQSQHALLMWSESSASLYFPQPNPDDIIRIPHHPGVPSCVSFKYHLSLRCFKYGGVNVCKL